MLKVILVHSVYLSHKNGANTVINLLLNSKEQFAKNGINIRYLAPNESKFVANGRGLRVRLRKFLSSCVKKALFIMAQKFDWAVKRMIQVKDQRPGEIIAKRYISEKPSADEVVFFHSLFACYYYLKNRNEKQHVVLVLHTNGEPFKMQRIYYERLENSAYFKEMLVMERYVLENVDRIVFVAQKPREVFLQLHSYISPERVCYIYNGVENKRLPKKVSKLQQGTPIEICCVASITNRKGQHLIVEALEKMSQKPNVHFTFVGDGSDKKKLEEQVRNNGLQDFIKFVGVTNNVDSYLLQSDAFILPSEDEGLPMAIIEAMRAALPIISTPVGGIPELLSDGYNGVMIEPSVMSVVNFLENVDNCEWERMGLNSRKLFEEKFTVEKMVDEYSKILHFE